jgi:hypothetical protein
MDMMVISKNRAIRELAEIEEIEEIEENEMVSPRLGKAMATFELRIMLSAARTITAAAVQVIVLEALHRTHRNVDDRSHPPAGPVAPLVRRFGAGQCHHPRRDFRRDRRFAGLAGFVAQQTFHPALGKALL